MGSDVSQHLSRDPRRITVKSTDDLVQEPRPILWLDTSQQLDEVLEGFCNKLWPCETWTRRHPLAALTLALDTQKATSLKTERFLSRQLRIQLELRHIPPDILSRHLLELGRYIQGCFSYSRLARCNQTTRSGSSPSKNHPIVFRTSRSPRSAATGSKSPSRIAAAASAVFVEPGEHAMPCEHVLCSPCVMLYGKQAAMTRMEAELSSCPIGVWMVKRRCAPGSSGSSLSPLGSGYYP